MKTQPFTRTLQLQLPYDRGFDVLALQRQLVAQGSPTGTPDGVFGRQTADGVRAWQARRGLPATGICDEVTWKRLFPDADDAAGTRLTTLAARMQASHHRFDGGCSWQLGPAGISVDGHDPVGTGGEPLTIRGIWSQYGPAIQNWSTRLGVPAELILATIATESSGKPQAIRFEPHYESDEKTPNQVSTGLMQTLISTAREALGNPAVDRAWLLQPENSVQAGTAVILKQSKNTGFDPPIVACCYNAGSVVLNDGAANRWRMRQFPIGTSAHCDRFVDWFNDAVKVLSALAVPPPVSFTAVFGAAAPAPAEQKRAA